MKRFGALIVGLIFLVVGGFMFFRNKSLAENCTVEAEATVVDMREDITSEGDGIRYMYYPIIEYKAGDDTVSGTLNEGSSTPAYRIGETLTILYNPNNTQEFLVKGSSGTLFSLIFAGIGVVITVVGIVLAIKNPEGVSA